MALLFALLLALSGLDSWLQNSSGGKPNGGRATTSENRHTSPQVYEDDEVRIKIPQGWRLATVSHPAIRPYKVDGKVVAGSSVTQANGKILLQKEGYTLALAYDTSHAGPGRFIEAFQIPWLDVMQAWSCSNFFTHIPQPANETLLFMNLVLRTGGTQLNKACGIKKGFGESVTAGSQSYFGSDRWFAGYFTSDDGYFFGSKGASCGVKSYTLTTSATVPEQLPPPDDTRLQEMISEAITIVNSIDYKRCAPSGHF